MSALSCPVAMSAASTPEMVPLVTPTPFWHTAAKVWGPTLPKPGAWLRERQT